MLGRIDHSILGPPVGQAPLLRVNEGEAFRVTIRVLDADLGATTPTTMRYRIDDIDQGAAVLDWTTLTPATSVNVVVTGAQNAIRSGYDREQRQIILEASDSDGALRKTIDYEIVNLQGV